jgi:hypothetical protein
MHNKADKKYVMEMTLKVFILLIISFLSREKSNGKKSDKIVVNFFIGFLVALKVQLLPFI